MSGVMLPQSVDQNAELAALGASGPFAAMSPAAAAPAPMAPAPGPFAAAPAPMPMQPTAAPGPYAPPAKKPAGHFDAIMRMAIPAILGTLGTKMAPHQTAAAIGGFMRGMERRRAETETDQEKAQRRADSAANFQLQIAQELNKAESPEQLDALVQMLEPVAQMHGVDIHGIAGQLKAPMAGNASRRSAASVLEANDKLYPGGHWSAPDPSGTVDPTTGKVAVRSRDWFAQQSGRNSFLAPPEKGDQPNTPEEEFYRSYAKEHGAKSFGELPTDQQREARQQWQSTNTDANKGLGTFEDYIARYAHEKGVDPKTLTTAQIEDARKRYNQADDKSAGGGGMVSTPGDTSVTGDAYLATIPPEMRDMVKKIANYEMDIAKVTSLRGDQRTRVAQMVAQYDPTFDMTSYPARQRTRNDFTSGKSAVNIRGINTAIGHLNALSGAFDALDNGNYHAVNAVENMIANNLPLTEGQRARQGSMTKLKTDFNAVKGELAGIFKSSGATDSEIRSWDSVLKDPTSATPAERKAFVEATIELMGSRMNALRQSYEVGLGKPADFQMLSPESRGILTKLGIDANQLDPSFGDGEAPKPTGPGAAGPSVGDRRLINGQLGEWDGKGWKPVAAAGR